MAHHFDAVPISVPDADEYVGILLDEWDTQITTWAEAARHAAQARRDLTVSRELMAIIEAETLLAFEGHTESERRSRLLLALHRHNAWRECREAVRAARERIMEAENRATLARMRLELVRAALTASVGRLPLDP